MEVESVIDFLYRVPLLQKLPASSLKNIATVVVVKHYDSGQFVIRKGDINGDVYFVWEGEAEVCGYVEEKLCPEFQLKRFDFFGNGASTPEQQVDVIASSQLACLVLPAEHTALLRPNSMRSAFMESILYVDQNAANIFQGITLPYAPKSDKVYGGQFIGQALAAASKTVDCQKSVHHLQAHFLLAGDYDIPITYEVNHLHDGNSFTSRRVDAIQNGKVVFTLLASFQRDESGFEHQEAVMPLVPPPDKLLSLDELCERVAFDPRLPRTLRNKVAKHDSFVLPLEIRFCDPRILLNQTKSPPRLRYWFRAKGKLSDDQAFHRCVVAYASDLFVLAVTSYPHLENGLTIGALSLNHTMWFHRTVKADDWLLYVIDSPLGHGCRGLCTGQIFNRQGELMVTIVQEGLLRSKY